MIDRRQRWEALVDAEAVGDELAPDELALAREIEQELASCRIERVLWRSIADSAALAPADDDCAALVDRALFELAPQTVATGTARPRRLSVRVVLAAASLAAALVAALALWPPKRPPGEAWLVDAIATVEVDGALVEDGASLPEGAVVRTRGGGACVRIDGNIDMCLADGTEAHLRSLAAPARVVEVIRGEAVARLDEQRGGDSFALASGDVVVTAVGTVFAVARADDDAIFATVLEGEVALASPHGDRPLTHQERAAITSTGLDVRVATSDEQNATRALLSPTRARDPVAVVVATVPPASAPVLEPRMMPTQSPAVARAKNVVESPSALLERARTLQRAGARGRAAKAYEELVQAHPSSTEAHAVRVALGDLQLELRRARAALRSYDRYLADGGGPLDREARLGRIRAYARIGDRAGERAAIESLLAGDRGGKHEKLRERLRQLDELDQLDRAGR